MTLRRVESEDARFRSQWTHGGLDPAPEAECDEIVRLAATICGTPVGFLTLLDERQQWFRVSDGFKLEETPREVAFCAYTIRQTELFVVQDALIDIRFSTNPLVAAEPSIRFFAGMPLHTAEGQPVGTLCVMDIVPRMLSVEQEGALQVLGRQASARLELRMQRRQLEEALKEKEKAIASLNASEELFRAFMNASPFLSYIKDAAGRLLFYNKSFAKRFGVGEYTWLGRTDERLWSPNLSRSARSHDLEVMAGGRMVETEERIRGADGTSSTWRSFKFPCHDSAGNVMLAGVAVDVTEEVARKSELERYHLELEGANEKLRKLAVTDVLTGLKNRRAFEERLVTEFSMARRRRRELAVLLLDVDNFKQINDRYGHAAGDDVLQKLGMLLRTTVRLPDLPARYGGEEFIVLLPESGEEGALGLARRLMERVAEEQWNNERMTVSIGMAAMNESLVNGLQLVALADEALYAAKRAGKNRAMLHGGVEISG
ncbi:diguanylate cyclase [Granulicella sp. dw_53]|uniref:GGDEF domain-containing protein n=1 Tax=Granulicella sp. dw_53 TaxID=2719792 RepID=UPI001BD65F3A|nr:diguanylate cyclase [Granulicella sp. dw_53]